MFLRTEIPDHSPNSGEQKHEANHTPHDRPTRGTVADQFFVRPVLCIGNILSGTVRAGCPRRPPEECGHLPLLCWIGQCARRNRISIAAVAIYVSIVGSQFLKGGSAVSVKDDRISCRVIGIAPSEFRQSSLKGRTRFGRRRLIISEAFLFCPAI